ncbi:hypothetical protein CCAX7_55920 [Capsulimonas corticalis]|uniref:Uncharacterized protein n=1 Tax=Capsulimonas corticalis TaxID=2219043 RepID=A0A402D0P9_9BACT|nr:hypothetical protein [Capsulimonas corticalis]BDI33541.1 hypothetical protein CCAX7_55920 [Capsulimonas corticalis]
MTGLRDIQEPPCSHDEAQWKGCLTFVGDRLTYYINRPCQSDLLWTAWFNYAESPIGEDPSLTNEFYASLTNFRDWIPYSETIVLPTKDAALRTKRHPLGYKRQNERLDFYVTKSEFAKAFRVIRRLGRWEKGKMVTEGRIFGAVRLVLLDDSQFGDPTPYGEARAQWLAAIDNRKWP